MLGTLRLAGARGSEAEFNLVKRMAIMSVSDREIIAFLGAKAMTWNWEICAKLKMVGSQCCSESVCRQFYSDCSPSWVFACATYWKGHQKASQMCCL